MQEHILKLTNSVYALLDFFPEGDPLKNRAKEKALAIFESVNSIYKEGVKQQVIEDINTLLGYLEIGKSQGWLNSVNVLIISNEYSKLIPAVRKPVKTASRPITPISLSDRQRKIVSFLVKNEKAQVMDLKGVLPQVTKRTIRRDLDELLQIGKVKRIGEFNQVFYVLIDRTGGRT